MDLRDLYRQLRRPFYDRAGELAAIRELLASRGPVLAIVYGRRSAGKSRLLEEAFGEHPYFSYTATTRVLAQQLADMQRAILALSTNVLVSGEPRAVEDVLNVLVQIAVKTPDVPFPIVIDELPYLADVDPGLMTSLQKWWKEQEGAGRNNLKLFLLGSRVSWMEREAVSETAALQSVRDANLEVAELSYLHAASFYSNFDPLERIRAWAVWGGLPGTLEVIAEDQSFWSNVERTTLQRTAKLYAEPDWLKYTELRKDALYASIVRAIATGERRPSAIAKAVGKSSANEISPHLARLADARIVARRPSLAAGGEEPRTATYVLADIFLAFWYRFVDPYRSLLERGLVTEVLDRLNDPEHGLDKFVSEQAFEDVCRSFLFEARLASRLPRDLRFDHVGSWWTGRKDERSDQLDVVAYDRGRLVALAECKWSTEPIGEGEIRELDRIRHAFAKELRPHTNCYRLLFSRSGFTRGVRELASDARERLLLFEPSDLYW